MESPIIEEEVGTVVVFVGRIPRIEGGEEEGLSTEDEAGLMVGGACINHKVVGMASEEDTEDSGTEDIEVHLDLHTEVE